MKRQLTIFAFFAAMPLSGCIHTVSGPGRALTPLSAVTTAKLRVVYAGQHYAQPDDFISKLDSALSRELAQPVHVEAVSERQFRPVLTRWPEGTAVPANGETTVVVRAVALWRCGTPAAAAIMFSAMTLGIFPFLDGDTIVWRTEIYNGPNLEDQSEFKVDWGVYGWLPLVPFVPLNMAWRAIRGDKHDYFLRTFPSHVAAALARAEHALAADAQKDARR
jgi:hypothetical protein